MHCGSKCHETKPLHSFVHGSFYLYQKQKNLYYNVKNIEFQKLKILENNFLHLYWLWQWIGTLVNTLDMLFILFVTLRSHKPWGVQWRSWYHSKALGKEGCIDFILWCLEFRCEIYWISKILMDGKVEWNNILFLKKALKFNKFGITGQNPTRQSSCISLCIELLFYTSL